MAIYQSPFLGRGLLALETSACAMACLGHFQSTSLDWRGYRLPSREKGKAPPDILHGSHSKAGYYMGAPLEIYPEDNDAAAEIIARGYKPHAFEIPRKCYRTMSTASLCGVDIRFPHIRIGGK